MSKAVTGFIRENRRWILLGSVGWSAVALLNTLTPALGRWAAGTPPGEAFQDFFPRILAVGVAAVLSPFVFLAFERITAAGRRIGSSAPLYLLLGVAYWVAAAAVMAGFGSASILPPPADPAQLRTELFWAYLSSTAFNLPILYLVMLLAYQVVRQLREVRQQEVQAAQLQAELSNAQAAELRARLNPEFLFQTFDVASELMQRDRRRARWVLSDLSELLRVSLGRSGEQRIALRDEVALLQRYLEIQKVRLEDRLEVGFDIAEEASSSLVPPLLLQPLVENWLEPPIERRRLEIRARRANGRLQLMATASGLSPAANADGSPGEETNIASVRTRLQLIYGADALLTCSSSMAGEGRIELGIPDHPAAVTYA